MVIDAVIDAVVLAGGRSSRLGSVAKATLTVENQSLLQRTVAAVRGVSRECVVVGPVEPGTLATPVLITREDPPFSGPAAALAAGVLALSAATPNVSDAILVLACDMPHISPAVPLLLKGLRESPDSDGAIARDIDGRLQPLAAVYRTPRLVSALTLHRTSGSLDSLPMFRLIDGLHLVPVDVPDGATADVDSWDDAERLGAHVPALSTAHEGEPHE